MTISKLSNVTELAAHRHLLSAHFNKIFSIHEHRAVCKGTPELLAKYGTCSNFPVKSLTFQAAP